MTRRLGGWSAFMIAFVVLAAGCESSKKNDLDDLIGRWNWSKLVIKGVTWSPLNPYALTPGGSTVISPGLIQQLDPNASLSVTLTFNEDKTVVGAVNATIPGQAPVSESRTGTWSAAGDVLTIRYQDGADTYRASGTYSVSGKQLTIALSNQQLLEILGDIDLAALTPEQRDLVNSLSGSAEFTR